MALKRRVLWEKEYRFQDLVGDHTVSGNRLTSVHCIDYRLKYILPKIHLQVSLI